MTGGRESAIQKHARLFGTGADTSRIEYFSDACFAIALTLLVLDIQAPELAPGQPLFDALVSLWPKYLGYAVSFAIVALNWVSHHRKFRVIERFDTGLIWINFLLIFFIALVPFPTSVLSEYAPDRTAVVLYAAVIAALGLTTCWLWAYARHARLLSAEVDRPLYRFILWNSAVIPIVFLASIPVALFVDPAWAMNAWILNWPASVLVRRIVGY